MRPTALLSLLAAALALPLAACGGQSAAAHNAADQTFLQDMLSHHRQAIAAAQLAESHGSDPRVVAFARRIVAEQTPEADRMQAAAAAAHLTLDLDAGADMAVHRITTADLTALAGLSGAAFDRQFLTLSISSEQGAVTMATTELAAGKDVAARAIAGPISGADHSEIPQLQALLSAVS